jgi:hypothetical protein
MSQRRQETHRPGVDNPPILYGGAGCGVASFETQSIRACAALWEGCGSRGTEFILMKRVKLRVFKLLRKVIFRGEGMIQKSEVACERSRNSKRRQKTSGILGHMTSESEVTIR